VARILCVDDDLNAVVLKKRILEQAGHLVQSCDSVDDAVFQLGRSKFDAVVTDWRLGAESGRSIVQAARETARVPVVVVSGYVSEAFQAAEPLADLYLEKPVDPHELVQVLSTLLETRAGENKSAT
jgi:DNA-binding response OmpR family regulator